MLDGPMNTAPTITGGGVYIGTWAGSVYALGDAGTALAPAPASSSETDATASPAMTSTATPAVAITSNPVEFVWQATGGPEPLASTFWVAVAPDGTIWANDIGQGQFQLFDPDRRYLETWAPPGVPADSELFVAFSNDGEIYVLDGAFVRTFDRDRNPVTTVRPGRDVPALLRRRDRRGPTRRP